ncbi:alginate export family protein [Flavobacterium sp. 5]|uniref:alginate export family protein n=1 Tax=Flavobacterium sp. 5 TaxID=2035199 RepID=UPI000C2C72C9|nr:alginate export family protein [Flavobacterium sp. 5]PKB18800.1 alginate export protein [Flavobacterium sp. 5]
MKKVILILFISNSLFSQQMLDFKMLRYDEDYFEKKMDTNATFFDKIKNISLDNHNAFKLSIGGELRLQYQYLKNEQWGDIPDDKDGFLLNRALLHTDFKYKNRFRLFTQLQSSTAVGRIDPSPVEKNELDFHQLFIDYNIFIEKSKITFRIGRQEMLLGSQRLVSVREGPNNRQAFDATRIMFENTTLKSELFYSFPVKNHYGTFDDKFDNNTKFTGSYTTIKKIPILENIDAYYFNLRKNNAKFEDASGFENRNTIGTRIWRKNHSWNYDFEAVYQFGDIGDTKIEAWTVSLNTTYEFNAIKFKPMFGLKTELISGNKNYGDTTIQTFNPLFPKGAYFGLAALIGPSNLYDIHPSISLNLSEDIVFSVDYDMFWRYSTNDGIYQPNTQLIYSGKNASEKYIGSQWEATLDYDVKKWLAFRLEGTWFKAGDYLQEVSAGKNILFGAATMYLRM